MPLNVVVLSEENTEHEDWCRLGAQSLARAYGDDEPEYTVADIRYQRRVVHTNRASLWRLCGGLCQHDVQREPLLRLVADP